MVKLIDFLKAVIIVAFPSSMLKVGENEMTCQFSQFLPICYYCHALRQSLTCPVFYTVAPSSPRPPSASCDIQSITKHVGTEILCTYHRHI